MPKNASKCPESGNKVVTDFDPSGQYLSGFFPMPSIVLKEKNPVRVVIAMGVALRLPAGVAVLR